MQGPLSTGSTTPDDPALVYGGNYGDDVLAINAQLMVLERQASARPAKGVTR
jgi:hypothetical protein